MTWKSQSESFPQRSIATLLQMCLCHPFQIYFFKMGQSRLLVLYFRLFKIENESCQWLDLNSGSPVSEATALPTEPHNRYPTLFIFIDLSFFLSLYLYTNWATTIAQLYFFYRSHCLSTLLCGKINDLSFEATRFRHWPLFYFNGIRNSHNKEAILVGSKLGEGGVGHRDSSLGRNKR